MGKVVKKITNAVGSVFGVPQAKKQAEAIQTASAEQATAIKSQADQQAEVAAKQMAAQQEQLKQQQVAANQAIQSSIDQRNLSTQLQQQMSKIKDAETTTEDAPVKVDLSLPTAADESNTRKKYQTGPSTGGASGVGIRVG